MDSFLLCSLTLFSINLVTHTKGQTACDITGAGATYSEIINGETRRIIANGCPNHDNTCVGKPGTCTIRGESANITISVETPKDVNIPSDPCLSDIPNGVDITCIGGPIGILFNGVSLFSQTAGGDECEDAISAEFTSFNICGGHATGTGQFHYHLAPACLLSQFDDHDDINIHNQHSPQIGWAMDGFPIYGPHGLDGHYIYKCNDSRADPDDCLDECNGHYAHDSNGHIIDEFMYHYHVTGPIGDLSGNIKTNTLNPAPDTSMFPYTIGCLKGIAEEWKPKLFRNAICSADGTTNVYVPIEMPGIAHIVYPEKVLQTINPSVSPTNNPIALPSVSPTNDPSMTPSSNPIPSPSYVPTVYPTNIPTTTPTLTPTNNPSTDPTNYPSKQPTQSPIIILCDSIIQYDVTYNKVNSFQSSTDVRTYLDETMISFLKDYSGQCEGTIDTLHYVYDYSYKRRKDKLFMNTFVCCGSDGAQFPVSYVTPRGYSAMNSDIGEISTSDDDETSPLMKYGIIGGGAIVFIILAGAAILFYRNKIKNKEERNDDAGSDMDEDNVLTPFTPNSQKIKHAVFSIEGTDDRDPELQKATLNMVNLANNINMFVE